jgi:hypothetical protein
MAAPAPALSPDDVPVYYTDPVTSSVFLYMLAPADAAAAVAAFPSRYSLTIAPGTPYTYAPLAASVGYGTPGPNPSPGYGIWNGIGAPASTTGVNGDFYIDTATMRLYGPKVAGAWPNTYILLVGQPGPVGPSGAVGASGTPTAGQIGVWAGATIMQGVNAGTGVTAAFALNLNGSGALVATTNATLVTPTLGVATATTLNKLTLTAPATSATLTIADTKTVTVNATLTFAGTDGTVMTFPSASSTVLTAGNTATITKGFTLTPNNIGTVSSGTTTPDPTLGNYQYLTNNGAFTLAAPASDCAIDLLVTNGASAGSITFSGYTVSASTGDPLTTTNTSKFFISIRRVNAVSTYVIKALQ